MLKNKYNSVPFQTHLTYPTFEETERTKDMTLNETRVMKLSRKRLWNKGIELVKSCLTTAEERLSYDQIREHPYFADVDFANLLNSKFARRVKVGGVWRLN